MAQQCCTVLYTDTTRPKATACGTSVLYCTVHRYDEAQGNSMWYSSAVLYCTSIQRGPRQQHGVQQCCAALYTDTTRPEATTCTYSYLLRSFCFLSRTFKGAFSDLRSFSYIKLGLQPATCMHDAAASCCSSAVIFDGSQVTKYTRSSLSLFPAIRYTLPAKQKFTWLSK